MLKISVVVVCYNTKSTIESCVKSLAQQDYSNEFYEILFVDNDSTDGTRQVIEKYAQSEPNIRLVINPVLGIAGSRNIGLQQAKYGYVAFTDADCRAPKNWLARLSAGFERHREKHENLVAVGGSNVPPQDHSVFYRTLHVFLNTFLGSHGSVQGKRFDSDKQVPHLPTVNVMYHRDNVLEIEGFDETLGNIGEDQDMSFRLEDAGYKMIYLADIAVEHHMRSTFRSWIKNMFVYGKGRLWLMRKHPRRREIILIFPMLLVIAFLIAIFGVVHPIFSVPFILYFVIVLLSSCIAVIREKKYSLFGNLVFLFITTHVAYGLGEWYGLFKNRRI